MKVEHSVLGQHKQEHINAEDEHDGDEKAGEIFVLHLWGVALVARPIFRDVVLFLSGENKVIQVKKHPKHITQWWFK